MSVAWDPLDIDEIECKRAFEALGRSADRVVLPSVDPAQPNRFVLRSKSYFDIQAYVLSGKDLPASYSDFDNKIPERTFKKLYEFDSEIHGKTRETMVVVGSTCRDFHENHLAKLVTAGQTAIQYSDNTVELLEAADFINLRHQLGIILDERYKSPNDFDDNYRDAKEASQMTLSMLRDDAREKHNRMEEVLQTLFRFREETLRNQQGVKFLTQQYKTGPVENRSNNKTPYLEILNKDFADSLVNFENKLREARDRYSDWEKNTATAVGTCWFGPLGWIATGVQATKADDLRHEYDKLQTLIGRLRQDQQDETNLIIFVNQLIAQSTDIDRKITEAIAATQELSQFYSNQADCYDKIAVSIDRMKRSDDMRARRQYIQYQMKVAVDKLRELKVVAEEFTRSILTQVEL